MEDRSQDRVPQFVRACAVEMHTGISQEPFYSKFTGKRLYAPEVSLTLCASLCSRNSDGHARTAILCENSFKKRNVAPQSLAAHCAQACTIEMHMDMSEQPFYARNYRKNHAPQKLGARFARGFRNCPPEKLPHPSSRTRFVLQNTACRASATKTHVARDFP